MFVPDPESSVIDEVIDKLEIESRRAGLFLDGCKVCIYTISYFTENMLMLWYRESFYT